MRYGSFHLEALIPWPEYAVVVERWLFVPSGGRDLYIICQAPGPHTDTEKQISRQWSNIGRNQIFQDQCKTLHSQTEKCVCVCVSVCKDLFIYLLSADILSENTQLYPEFGEICQYTVCPWKSMWVSLSEHSHYLCSECWSSWTSPIQLFLHKRLCQGPVVRLSRQLCLC